MHAAQGFGYPFPDLDSPMFVSKLVLEDEVEDTDAGSTFTLNGSSEAWNSPENGAQLENDRAERREVAPGSSPHNAAPRGKSSRITMAVLLRLTAETYLLHDPDAGTPRRRWQRILALHEAARRDAAARGLDDVQAFLPPPVARAFGRRLERLGWSRDPWPCFSRQIT